VQGIPTMPAPESMDGAEHAEPVSRFLIPYPVG
jgi:hypothetical protein